MRPAEFTPEVIIEAGRQLQAAGRNITGFALRQHIGGGNPARLREVWEMHLANQATVTLDDADKLPMEVAEKIKGALQVLRTNMAELAIDVNQGLVKAARLQIEEAKQAADAQINAEREAVRDAERAFLVYETERERQASEINELRSELSTLRVRAETAEREAKAAAERIAKAEADQVQATKEANTAREDAAKVRGQLEATQAQAADLLRALKERQAEDNQSATKPAKGKKGE